MPLETRLSLAPGQNGTKKLLAQYGDKLVRVRYRYDSERSLRIKTVELIVESIPWTPRSRARRREPSDMIGVAIAYRETELRARIKAAGGIWRPRHRLWEIDWKTARELGIEDRVIDPGWGYPEPSNRDIQAHMEICIPICKHPAAYPFRRQSAPDITS